MSPKFKNKLICIPAETDDNDVNIISTVTRMTALMILPVKNNCQQSGFSTNCSLNIESE